MMTVSHRERLETCLSGEKPDRPPIAFWRHFPVADQNHEQLVRMTLEFQERYDFDLVKITPASSYCLIDWGSRDDWQGNPEGTRSYVQRTIHHPEDWLKLVELDPSQGNLSRILSSVRQIKSKLGDHTPVIQTIFNPLSQAKNLAGQDILLEHMQNHPQELLAGLKTITKSTIRFIDELKRIGIDGVFYAIQHAQTHILTIEEFLTFSYHEDDEILSHCSDFWLNMIHLHGEKIMIKEVSSLPSHVLNWHDRETGLSLHQVQSSYPMVVCGGLARDEDMLLGNPDLILKQVQDAYDQTDGKRWIAGTGCVLMTTTPEINIHSAREFIERI